MTVRLSWLLTLPSCPRVTRTRSLALAIEGPQEVDVATAVQFKAHRFHPDGSRTDVTVSAQWSS
jgi:hypothetical protein